MKKVIEFIKNILKSKMGRIIIIFILLLVVLGIVFLCTYNKKPKLSNDYIITTLEKASELTTAKLNYTGLAEYEDTGIGFINKSNFKMVYKATARAGIDVEKIKVDVNDALEVVTLTIPKATILDVKVNSNDIKYYDEKFSLFNFDSKEDANKAVALAEENAKVELSNMGVLEMADTQAEALIKGLLQDAIPSNYDIKVKSGN